MKIKKVVTAGLITAMILGVTACGTSEKNSAKAVMKEYQKVVKNSDSIRVKGTSTINLGVEADGTTISVPIDLDMDIVTNGKDKAKVNVTTKMSLFGEEQKTKAETYSEIKNDSVTTYTKEDGDETWTVSTTKIKDSTSDSNIDCLIKGAKFEKTDDGYTITQSVYNIMGSEAIKDYVKKAADKEKIDIKEIEKQFKDCNIEMIFDKDCKLIKTRLDNAAVKTNLNVMDSKANLDINISFDTAITYDDAEESDYTVTEKIKKEATTTA